MVWTLKFFHGCISEKKRTLVRWGEKLKKKMRYVLLGSIFWSRAPVNPRHLARLEGLLSFYDETTLDAVLIPVTSGEVDASLRLLDWFVINYSRRHKLHLEGTNIYQSYRNWRRFWRQDLFDVCRRGQRVYFERQGVTHTTTIAQMNYMYWAQQHGVRAYVESHKTEIAFDMSQRIRRLTKQGVRRKRLVIPSGLACTVIAQPVNVEF